MTSPDAASILSADLIAHYLFDDTPSDGALDSTGNGHTGACVSTCPVIDASGRTAYRFNGVGDVIQIADAPDLHPVAFTVSAWIRRVDGGRVQIVASKAFGSASRKAWRIEIGAADGVSFCTIGISGQTCSGTSPGRVLADTWMHVAYTTDGTRFRGYLDAEIINDSSTDMSLDDGPILLGAGAATGYFGGSLDDVRIYGRAFTAAEIAILATL